MGAVCGKSSHFEGEGQVLGSSQSPASKQTTQPQKLGSAVVGSASSNTGDPSGGGERLGGSGRTDTPDAAERRKAALEAAERRAKQDTGKLGSKLDSQSQDGGRKKQAILEGSQKDQNLVWD